MALWAVRNAGAAFAISETCCRYRARLSSENDEIADWLIRLTNNQRNWGKCLCFPYLRNVKQFRSTQQYLQKVKIFLSSNKNQSELTPVAQQYDNGKLAERFVTLHKNRMDILIALG
jgi:hypothetical protein